MQILEWKTCCFFKITSLLNHDLPVTKNELLVSLSVFSERPEVWELSVSSLNEIFNRETEMIGATFIKESDQRCLYTIFQLIEIYSPI